MSLEISPVSSNEKIHQVYTAEWVLNHLTSKQINAVQTPDFHPISDVKLKFCFDIRYQIMKMDSNGHLYSSFKLNLVKLFESQIPSDLKVNIETAVYYYDGTIFKEYKQESISVTELSLITCIQNDCKCMVNDLGRTAHYEKLTRGLTLKCQLTFYDHPATLKYCRGMRSLNNLKTFAQDFSVIYEPQVFSDVTFQIENETLFAHKSVLASHSPVFMKMLTNDFVELKNNSITIVDVDIDLFKCFLKYLYSGTIDDISWSTLKPLYILADKYDVKTLMRECADEIAASAINLKQICEILKFAYAYDIKDLIFEAKKFAADHFQLLISGEEWNSLVDFNPLIGYEVIAYSHSVPIRA